MDFRGEEAEGAHAHINMISYDRTAPKRGSGAVAISTIAELGGILGRGRFQGYDISYCQTGTLYTAVGSRASRLMPPRGCQHYLFF